jgi:hypothetical protein
MQLLKELQQQRDRLNAAIKALSSVTGNTSRTHAGNHVSCSPQADCCCTKSKVGEAERQYEFPQEKKTKAAHLSSRAGEDSSSSTGKVGEDRARKK